MSTLPRAPKALAVALLTGALAVTTNAAPARSEPAHPDSRAHADQRAILTVTKLELGDTVLEAHERLVVTLKALTGGSTDPKGTVTVTDQAGEELATEPVVDRIASFHLEPGITSIKLTYLGDGTWTPATASGVVNVAKAKITPVAQFSSVRVDRADPVLVAVEPRSSEPNYVFDGFYTLLARPVGTTGSEDFVLSQGKFPGPGAQTFDISRLSRDAGAYQVHFQSTETRYHASFTGLIGTVTVDPARAPTDVTTTVPTAPAAFGSGNVRVTAALAPARDDGPIDGTLQLLVDGRPFGAPHDITTTDQFTFLPSTLEPGSHAVQVEYSGGTAYAPSRSATSTLVVTQAHTATQVVTRSVEQAGPVQVQVGATDSQATPVGAVSLRENGQEVASAGVVGGVASVRLPAGLSPGPHTLTAVYTGTGSFEGSTSAPSTVQVTAPRPAPSKVTGTATRSGSSTVKVAARVTSSEPVTGKVKVLDGGTVVKTITLGRSDGGKVVATLRHLRPGSHRVSVRYLGTTAVKASSRTWTVHIPRHR